MLPPLPPGKGQVMAGFIAFFRQADWITPRLTRNYLRLLLGIEVVALLVWIGATKRLISLDGIPIGSDFTGFWSAAKLVLGGQAAAAYRTPSLFAAEQALVHGRMPGYVAFFYPPIFLLYLAPLAFLAYPAALTAWLGASGWAYFRALRAFAAIAGAETMILAFPAAFFNVLAGQNGFLTTALFAGAILYLERRPVAAGICFGCLAYKPHLGLLIPLALLVSRRWRVIAAAATTLAVLALASLALFGRPTWSAFLAALPAARNALIHKEVGAAKMTSVFAALQLLHAGNGLATVAQVASGAFAAFTLARAWASGIEVRAAGALLVTATLLTTPFLLTYDLVLLSLPIAWLANEGLREGFRPYEKSILLFAYVMPQIVIAAARIHLPLAAVAILALHSALLRRLPSRRAQDPLAANAATKHA